MGSIYEKKHWSKISCYCPFKVGEGQVAGRGGGERAANWKGHVSSLNIVIFLHMTDMSILYILEPMGSNIKQQ